jgi:hypothetical protein
MENPYLITFQLKYKISRKLLAYDIHFRADDIDITVFPIFHLLTSWNELVIGKKDEIKASSPLTLRGWIAILE